MTIQKRQPGERKGSWRPIGGGKVSPLRIRYTDPSGMHYYEGAEVRNGLPVASYQYRGDQAAAAVERVCRWRRSLIAAVLVLELAAEQQEADAQRWDEPAVTELGERAAAADRAGE